jgi:hypothetical protein
MQIPFLPPGTDLDGMVARGEEINSAREPILKVAEFVVNLFPVSWTQQP